MDNNFLYTKLCRKCHKPFNIGSNFEICPICRLNTINKLKEEKIVCEVQQKIN
jgi:hypothetical protein